MFLCTQSVIQCFKGILLHCGAIGSPGFDSWPEVSLHGVCMFSLCMHGFSPGTRASSHSPKNMTVRLTGLSKLPLGVNECVHGCLFCMSLCCPATDRRPVQGVPASRR
ncbi:hypothetical protein ILYODFUR_025592 [Ilyodon furcidens]|uniref:Uncharacterized protein n=1 Tax=Ilyodon furcidens TaxID=33524 RepID=A0ABV0TZF5_9TELE